MRILDGVRASVLAIRPHFGAKGRAILPAHPSLEVTPMSVLDILEFPDPRLRTKAVPVTVFDDRLKQFVADLFETMYAANGVGLAATQVNVHQRVLVIDMSEERNQPLVLINAEILEKDGAQVYQEGCLSFPGIYADVTRALKVKVKAHDVDGKEFTYEAEGPLAVAVQHEMDHLAGKVFVDYLSPLKRSLLLKRMEKHRKASA
jgi:peptide deformylase